MKIEGTTKHIQSPTNSKENTAVHFEGLKVLLKTNYATSAELLNVDF